MNSHHQHKKIKSDPEDEFIFRKIQYNFDSQPPLNSISYYNLRFPKFFKDNLNKHRE